MSKEPVLVELRTEELPPKSLRSLSEAFADAILVALRAQHFATTDSVCTAYATPRRLAVLISEVAARQPDRIVERKGPAVSSGLDADGKPARALEGFMRAAGASFDELERTNDGKGEYFVVRRAHAGENLEAHLAEIVAQAVRRLPIPKLMRWGDSEHQFVRPVHGLILLHGSRVIAGEVLGLSSGRTTLGHRFLSTGKIVIDRPEAYATRLAEARVIASFAERRASIATQLEAAARRIDARLIPEEALLDEVTALVEWPVVHVGEFEREYLEVPQECLVLTMQQNQKYFPLFDDQGKLLNRFLIVSNMAVANPTNIVSGNERVVRPRLSDARFFFDQDRKTGFASRVIELGSVVHHHRLGSLGDRAQRMGRIARNIAEYLGADGNLAERAALFAKIDLLTDMVGEFPELQGIMGRYYLLHEGGMPVVAEAIEQHYRPRFAGDLLPQGNIACAAALADKLDLLVGFFGIGQVPTGDRDPFGLRRAALGVLRILMETPLPLDLGQLIDTTRQALQRQGMALETDEEPLLAFIYERLRGLLREAGHPADVVEAVLANRPRRIDLIPARLSAVTDFLTLPEAQALAAANKRIGNILRKAEAVPAEPDIALLEEDAEKALFERVLLMTPLVRSHVHNEDYADALKVLASVRSEVDRFFDEVMVNVDEPLLRANRLGLLKGLYEQLNAVADISKLAV
ncbi:glycine--tRNA ligase subunit beta [Accumulibacter sp.]|uniref:glycine--tRNA ligase subunit beta n=1 Tax=Accumulibacter sp. TaxID=2053492 RepID=UPI0025D7FC80|nr:glycine--tRNA ligase subunit beta [Accumulibacter sp.]MCM8595797.1 glycine--tRNA ligase subunit beta [Accumulibacter sp.]MCM8626518.1 glycine--tRNA ligase subunit beta [Accumulibacter sp.]MDS4049945.1 glycine--tRNA ligase subunit beta [Accumulibacter sp.]